MGNNMLKGALITLTIAIFTIIPMAQARNANFETQIPQVSNLSTTPWVNVPNNNSSAAAEWVTLVEEDLNLPTSSFQCQDNGYLNFPINADKKYSNQGECINAYDKATAEAITNNVLVLSKYDAGQFNSGVKIDGAEGLTLEQLGFDYSGDCGAAGPRFNVNTTIGNYFFNCSEGVQTDLGNDWKQVRFNNSNAKAGENTPDFPGFGNIKSNGIEIVMDEPGKVMIDNIYINGITISEMDKK